LSGLFSVTHFQSDGGDAYLTPEIWQYGELVQPSEERIRVNSDFLSDNVLVKLDCALPREIKLTVNNDFFYTERGQPGTVWDVREEARQELFRNLTQVKLEKRAFLLSDLNIDLSLYHRYNQNHFTDPVPRLSPTGENPIDTISKDRAYGIKGGAVFYWEGGGTDHLITFRGDLRRDELRDEVQPWEQGYDDPERTSFEWHLQDEVVLLDGYLSVLPAVRYEESTDFGHHWSGKLGVMLKPFPWLHAKYNIENTFRKPNFSELYFPNEGWIRGNPDLQPETGRSFDAGFILNFSRFFFEAAYFQNWIEESIQWLPISFWTIQPVNTGPVDAWGFEMNTEYRPWDILFLTANYTFLHAISEETGEQQDGKPEHEVNLKASLQGDLGEIYTEIQYLSVIPLRYTSSNKSYINPRTLVDAGIIVNLLSLPVLEDIRHLGKWTLGLEVKNAGNVSAYDSLNMPLPGRMFFITTHAAF